jgi:hypothetical protein
MNTESIRSRADFILFVQNLHNEYLKNGENWENNTLDTFLEKIGAYAEDIDGYYLNRKQNENPEMATWKAFADILVGATIYE